MCVQQAEECDGAIAQLEERQGSVTFSLRDKRMHLNDLQNTRAVLTRDLSALQETKERVSQSTNSISNCILDIQWRVTATASEPVILYLNQPLLSNFTSHASHIRVPSVLCVYIDFN